MVDSPKFESLQRVRVGGAGEMEKPGHPIPDEQLMGMIGIVEVGGRVSGSDAADKRILLPAYLVRFEGSGPVLVGEDWLEDAPTDE